LAEFWMVEPEIAFADLNTIKILSEELIKYVTSEVLDKCQDEMQHFVSTLDDKLMERMKETVQFKFKEIDYKNAIDILQKAAENDKQLFKFPISYGMDLQREHEIYLCEVYSKGPIFVTKWPKDIKPFYMRLNDDNQTVAALDLLVPHVGEIIGGSEREERLEQLKKNMEMKKLNLEGELEWYLDLRRYGTVPHAGFGLGFERLVQYLTGMKNIKDTIPIPRYIGYCKF